MSRDRKQQYELRDLKNARALPPPLPPHVVPSAPPSPSLVDPYACYDTMQRDGLQDVELKQDALSQSAPPLPPRTARPAKAPQPEPPSPQVRRVLDASQAQARQLTTGAVKMKFRIHDVLVCMGPCSFDDLPEMATWLNRGIFLRGEFIRDSPLRVLVCLDALMQAKYRTLFRSWAQEVWDHRNGKRRRSGVFRTTVIVPEFRYFFYGDSIGILYERTITRQRRTWCCCAAVYSA